MSTAAKAKKPKRPVEPQFVNLPALCCRSLVLRSFVEAFWPEHYRHDRIFICREENDRWLIFWVYSGKEEREHHIGYLPPGLSIFENDLFENGEQYVLRSDTAETVYELSSQLFDAYDRIDQLSDDIKAVLHDNVFIHQGDAADYSPVEREAAS